MTIERVTIPNPAIPPINTFTRITMLVDGYDFRAIDDILDHKDWTGLADQHKQLIDLRRRMVLALSMPVGDVPPAPRKLNS